jgi:iron complex outermembrane recepter protein
LRNWKWPHWNIESVYFRSTTALGDKATLKTRAYYNELENLLQLFDDRSQTTQILGRAFDSPYDDNAYGGSAELAVALTPANTLALAFHYRRDEHNESQTGRPGLPASVPEPVQTSVERTWSAAVENRLDLSPALRLTLGASYDWRDLDKAEDTTDTPLVVVGFPLRNAAAWNAQGRLD